MKGDRIAIGITGDEEATEGAVGERAEITQHRLRQHLDAELGRLGITAPQNAVLLAVVGNPRISNAELARVAFVTPQTMQAILVNLERAGLIVRSPHPEHGRVIMTEPTTAGQEAIADGAKAADAVQRRMLSKLSTEEARLLCELLKRCAAALDDEPSDR